MHSGRGGTNAGGAGDGRHDGEDRGAWEGVRHRSAGCGVRRRGGRSTDHRYV